jgi:hypothetical protein
MLLKIELEEKELSLLMDALLRVDPTQFFSKNLIDKIRQQHLDQRKEFETKNSLTGDEAAIVRKLEKEISKQANQPASFSGQIGELITPDKKPK